MIFTYVVVWLSINFFFFFFSFLTNWQFSFNFPLIYIYIFTHYLFQVEDVVSRAADGTSAVQDLDFASLRSQLGPLAAVSAHNVNSLFPYFESL
jgi:hypothetical protein